MVFLHEGLGSVSMWRDFPDQVCAATGMRGLVYSRPGYGRSSPRLPGISWGRDYLHFEAQEILPALLARLETEAGQGAVWLFGHSDGGSIALIHAAERPEMTAGLIVLAPHIMVEDACISAIEGTVRAFADGDLRERLSKHHNDPEATFVGWSEAWLNDDFRSWSIEALLERIECPVLAIQGLDDGYGTMEQIDGIARRARRVKLVKIPKCGHSPHRDAPQRVIQDTVEFVS
jgi:pimeloyl-ACP methyl ester carboxylesterase